MLEKSFSEVIKVKYSDSDCEEHMPCKHWEQWGLIDADATNVLTSCTPRMIKCIAGTNHCGERIKTIDKRNTTASFPLGGKIEDLNYFVLCECLISAYDVTLLIPLEDAWVLYRNIVPPDRRLERFIRASFFLSQSMTTCRTYIK